MHRTAELAAKASSDLASLAINVRAPRKTLCHFGWSQLWPLSQYVLRIIGTWDEDSSLSSHFNIPKWRHFRRPGAESRSIRAHAAWSASLNFCCICWTQSRPVTSNRARIKGSFSSREASNSCRACFLNLSFQGTPLSSHQWKCFAVRRISRYRLRASARWEANREEAWRDALGIHIWGGIVDVGAMTQPL